MTGSGGHSVRRDASVKHDRPWNTGSPVKPGDDIVTVVTMRLHLKSRPALLIKKSACPVGQIRCTFPAVSARSKRGASRSSRTLSRRCDGRGMSQHVLHMRTNGMTRTAKSCGPGIPVLMPSSRCFDERRGRRGQESRSPGRARISVKTVVQGRPVVRLSPVVLPRAFLLHADHGCGQHPVFPAPSLILRAIVWHSSGRSSAARLRTLPILHSSCPAHAGHPVRRGLSFKPRRHRNTGSPAFLRG